jgi:hypothetical protein
MSSFPRLCRSPSSYKTTIDTSSGFEFLSTFEAFTYSLLIGLSSSMNPIQFNEKSGEPFIPLKSHSDIILTPLRFDDVPRMVEMLNDQKIIKWFDGPPYPYYEGKSHI